MSKMEEKKLLKSMLKERDKKIALLQGKRKQDEDYLASIKSQIDDIEGISVEDESAHKKVMAEIDLEQKYAEDEMKDLERDMHENAKLHEYAKLIKSVSQSNVDTTYVLRLQSQLMKSMHSMGMLDNQMKLLKKHCNSIVKSLKDEISNAIDEKCKSEVNLMNHLAQLDKEKHELEAEYKQKIDERRAALSILEEQLGLAESDQDEMSESSDQEAGEDDVELEIEIEDLKSRLETLTAEKESMEQHLKMAIDEKDEVLSQLREERCRQEEMAQKHKEKNGHASVLAKERNVDKIKKHHPWNDALTEEGGSKAGEKKEGMATGGAESRTQSFSDDETSETLRSEWSNGDDDKKETDGVNSDELPVIGGAKLQWR